MVRLASLLVGFAVFLTLYAIFRPRLRPPTLHGNSRTPTIVLSDPALHLGSGPLPDTTFNRYIRPTLRGLSPETQMGAWLASRNADKVRELLIRSGNPMRLQPHEYRGVQMLSCVAGIAVGVLLGSLHMGFAPKYWIILGAVMGFFGPTLYHRNEKDNRQRQVRRQLPEALDLLTITMTSGKNFMPALGDVSSRLRPGVMRDEVQRTFDELTSGRRMADTMGSLARRAPTIEVENFAKSVIQGETVGADIVETLRGQSAAARAAHEAAVDAKAASLAQTLVVPVMVFMVPALLIVMVGPSLSSIGSAL